MDTHYNPLTQLSGSFTRVFGSPLILVCDLWMQKMGSMTVIPYIGDERFNTFYPIFMVIYTGLLASNVLNRVMDYFGSWRYFRSHDAEDGEGFDPSGLIILRKGTWIIGVSKLVL